MFITTASLLFILSALSSAAAAPWDRRDNQSTPLDNPLTLWAYEWLSVWSLDRPENESWGGLGVNSVSWDFRFDDGSYNKEHFNMYTYYKAGDGDNNDWNTWSSAELVTHDDIINKADTKYDCIIQGEDGQIASGGYILTAVPPYIGGDARNPVHYASAECTVVDK